MQCCQHTATMDTGGIAMFIMYMHAMLLSSMNKGRDVVYTISEVGSSDRVDTPGMPEAKSSE